MKKLLVISKAADPFYSDTLENLGMDMDQVATCGNIGGILSYVSPNAPQIAVLDYEVVDNEVGLISHEKAAEILRAVNDQIEIVVLGLYVEERDAQFARLVSRLS